MTCRFPRDVEASLEALAVAQEGYAQDVVRSLVMEALAARAAGGASLDTATTAAREAGQIAGYAEAHNRWRKTLGRLLQEEQPPDHV